MAKKSCKNLPDDLWELIMNHLPHHTDFEPLTLVSKQLLNLTNQLRPKLVVTHALKHTHNDVPSLINKRCPKISSIDLSHYDSNIDDLLLGMANNCPLEKLREIDLGNVGKIPYKGLFELRTKIRVLKLSNIRVLRNADLFAIGVMFPLLEELDISYPRGGMTNVELGIMCLSGKTKNLRRINLSGNNFVSDACLVRLGENCVFLEGVDVVDCRLVTAKGVLFLLRNSVNLSSISASGINTKNGSIGYEDMSFPGRRLCSLDLRMSSISEEFIHNLLEACGDLRRLSFTKCKGFSVFSLALLLRKCRRLQHLALYGLDCLTDEDIIKLFPYMHNLVTLQLGRFSSKFNLIASHNVARRCRSLENALMERYLRWKMRLRWEFVKYANIKSLNLSKCYNIDRYFVVEIVSACRELEILDISYCNVTNECLAKILGTCHGIRILSISGCQIDSIGKGAVLPKLEVLNAANSAINDEGLAQIAIRCPRVEKLGLASCFQVTVGGVKEVVGTCQILKEINLYCCRMDDYVNLVSWMISMRSSLVKIVPPSYVSPSESEDRVYLQHGCQILDGSKYEVPKIWE